MLRENAIPLDVLLFPLGIRGGVGRLELVMVLLLLSAIFFPHFRPFFTLSADLDLADMDEDKEER